MTDTLSLPSATPPSSFAGGWINIEQAAVLLALSVRTVNRHITAGKLASRLHEGRREVYIDPSHFLPPPKAPDVKSQPAASDGSVQEEERTDADPATPPPSRASSNDSGIYNAETVLALADNVADKADLAVAAYQTLARTMEEQSRAVRKIAWFAWSAVAMMGIGVTVAVGWTAHHLTQAQVQAENLRQQATIAEQKSEKMNGEMSTLQQQLREAMQASARAEGQLSAFREVRSQPQSAPQPAAAPASQPALTPTTSPAIAPASTSAMPAASSISPALAAIPPSTGAADASAFQASSVIERSPATQPLLFGGTRTIIGDP